VDGVVGSCHQFISYRQRQGRREIETRTESTEMYGYPGKDRKIKNKRRRKAVINWSFDDNVGIYTARLCDLVVLGYRSGGPSSIPGTTRKKK
jgi:hypothetical protein